MADHIIDIPVSVGDQIFAKDEKKTVSGGGTRLVPMVPIGDSGERLPCIWKSHYTVQAELSDGSKVPAHECLLLLGRNPLATIRAEVAVEAWQYFGTGPIEW